MRRSEMLFQQIAREYQDDAATAYRMAAIYADLIAYGKEYHRDLYWMQYRQYTREAAYASGMARKVMDIQEDQAHA